MLKRLVQKLRKHPVASGSLVLSLLILSVTLGLTSVPAILWPNKGTLTSDKATKMVTSRRTAPTIPQAPNDLQTAPTGVHYDAPITFKIDDTIFKVPAAYLVAWPTSEMANKINGPDVNQGISFMFWVPDKRPVLVKTVPPLVSPKPQEPGRPVPKPEDYAVLVMGFRFVKADAPGYISPVKQQQNLSRLSNGDDQVVEQHGLRIVKFGKDKIGTDWYLNIPGTEPELTLDCFTKETRAVSINPQCHRWVRFDHEDIAFYVRFSWHLLPRWREVVEASRELGLAWRQPSAKP
jgi:hypothetical protein